MSEAGFIAKEVQPSDTASISAAIKNYQQFKKLKPTGRISEALVRDLNNTDREKFKSIAITLDRYKLLSDTLPKTYILVNIPSFRLKVYTSDSLVLQSKVIVGSPKTKTPLLNSQISNFITYPQWTVPYIALFLKKCFPRSKMTSVISISRTSMIVDKYDSVIDPSTVHWGELNKDYFPYLLRQREGDDNSLGVIKFNFPNKYSVYLHDTNTRWMFNNSSEGAKSWMCVRVQEWEQLARFLVRADTVRYPIDTLRAWISRQEKHTVSGFPRVPLFIRYFTVEAQSGHLRFFDDTYGYDKLLKEKFFNSRSM